MLLLFGASGSNENLTMRTSILLSSLLLASVALGACAEDASQSSGESSNGGLHSVPQLLSLGMSVGEARLSLLRSTVGPKLEQIEAFLEKTGATDVDFKIERLEESTVIDLLKAQPESRQSKALLQLAAYPDAFVGQWVIPQIEGGKRTQLIGYLEWERSEEEGLRSLLACGEGWITVELADDGSACEGCVPDPKQRCERLSGQWPDGGKSCACKSDFYWADVCGDGGDCGGCGNAPVQAAVEDSLRAAHYWVDPIEETGYFDDSRPLADLEFGEPF